MPKPYIVTGIDIGSSAIKILSIAKRPGEEDFDVLGYGQKSSFGVRNGVVVDVPRVAETITELVQKLEQDSGQRIESAYVGIGGGHIFSAPSRGLISISRADQKVSEEDVDRVLQAAQTFSLPSNKEIIDTFPKEFIVDGAGGVREAVGMQGVRLEVEVVVLCGFSPFIRNSTQAVLSSGLQLADLIPTFLASARAVLTHREKELGVVLLDIGAGTCGMTVFEEGSLIHAAIFPIGSGHITNDIAICLKTDIDTAEKIKLEYGFCRQALLEQKSVKSEKKIKIEGEEQLLFSKKALVDIIEARVSEIFELANKELKKISKQALLPAGVVLTGGGVKLPGIREFAKKELKLPCRIAAPQAFASLEREPSFSALCGLVLEGADMEEENGNHISLGKSIKDKVKRALRVFIP